MLSIFSDGGVLGRNPSTAGGTWAWCHVRDDEIVRSASGIVTPDEIGLPTVTNNLTELLALLLAYESLPAEDSEGCVGHTDSQVTMFRFRPKCKKYEGVPSALVNRVKAVVLRHQPKIVLLGGHPSQAELRAGMGKRGLPCSKWNCWCDDACNKRAKAFLRSAAEASEI